MFNNNVKSFYRKICNKKNRLSLYFTSTDKLQLLDQDIGSNILSLYGNSFNSKKEVCIYDIPPFSSCLVLLFD